MLWIVTGPAVVVTGLALATSLAPRKLFDLVKFLTFRALGMRRGEVQAADHKISFLEKNDGEQTIVLLHGFGTDKAGWVRFAHLFSGYRVILLDLPGFGESEWKASERYGLEEQVQRLAAILDALHLDSVHLAGNSMGAGIAGLFAATHPERVKTLLLMNNAGVDMPRCSDYKRILAGGDNPLLVRTAADLDRLLRLVFFKVPNVPTFTKRLLVAEVVARAEAHAAIFEHLLEDATALEEALERIAAPTLVLWGRHDRVLDVSIAEAMRPRLRRSRTIVLDDCGHLPHLEKPGPAARLFREWMEQAAA